MRDIEFRRWDKFKEEFIHIRTNHDVEHWFNGAKEMKELPLSSANLEQYTGLLDKNGNKIFEGDIYHQGDKNIKYKVIFKYGQFLGNQIGNQSLEGLSYWIDVIEVTGNIHE